MLEAAIDAGCDDYEMVVVPQDDDDDRATTTTLIYTDPKEVAMMVEAVQSLGNNYGEEGSSVKMSLQYVSKAPVECSEEDFEKNMEIIDALEELDDVDSVEHNMSN